jgi:hypothetical protein
VYLGDPAYEKTVDGATVQVRDPWRVGVLAVVTLGVYGCVWFYKANRELRDVAEAEDWEGVGFNPVLALLLLVPGAALIVPALAAWVHFVLRLRRAQERARSPHRISGWATALLAVVALIPLGAIVFFEYLQFHLNAVWGARRGEAPAAERTAASTSG